MSKRHKRIRTAAVVRTPSPAPKVTVLPRVTREMVLEENPDLAWSRETPHLTGKDARFLTNRNYEGRGGG